MVNDPSDCSMCAAGDLDDEAQAALEARASAEPAEAEAAAGPELDTALQLGRHRGGGSRPLPEAASASEQVFKADAHYVGSKIDIYALKARPEFSGHYKKVGAHRAPSRRVAPRAAIVLPPAPSAPPASPFY